LLNVNVYSLYICVLNEVKSTNSILGISSGIMSSESSQQQLLDAWIEQARLEYRLSIRQAVAKERVEGYKRQEALVDSERANLKKSRDAFRQDCELFLESAAEFQESCSERAVSARKDTLREQIHAATAEAQAKRVKLSEYRGRLQAAGEKGTYHELPLISCILHNSEEIKYA